MTDIPTGMISALCREGKWRRYGCDDAFSDFALWHSTSTGYASAFCYWNPNSPWVKFSSWLWFRWVTVSPSISRACTSGELKLFRDWIHGEMSRMAAIELSSE